MSIRDILRTAPPKDVVRLALLRHGELEAPPGTVIGDVDLPLSARGKEQMEHAKRALTGVGLSAVYTSDLRRGKESCRLLLEGRSAPPVYSDVRALREQSFGAWQGRTWDALRAVDHAAVDAFFANPAEARPPSGESLAEVKQRVAAWWRTLCPQYRGKTVLAATSLGPIRSILSEALELPLTRVVRLVPGPGSFTLLDIGPSFWIVHAIGG